MSGTSEDIVVAQCNKTFNSQMSNEIRYTKRLGKEMTSTNWYHREIFNLTINFNITDWRILRTDEYWKRFDQLTFKANLGQMERYDSEREKKILLYKHIKEYIQNKSK